MKKMYIVNLDKSRIIILAGLVLAIFGFSFLLGSRFSGAHPNPENAFFNNHNPDSGQNGLLSAPGEDDSQLEALVEEASPQESQVTALPAEDKKLFQENTIKIVEDPFLSSAKPSVERKESFNSDSSSKKNQKAPSKSTSVSSSSAKPVTKTTSNQKSYSVQLGAYVHEKDAISFRKKLLKEGLKEARVDRGIRFYYVRAGRFHNKSDVEQLYKKIHDTMKLEAIVVLR